MHYGYHYFQIETSRVNSDHICRSTRILPAPGGARDGCFCCWPSPPLMLLLMDENRITSGKRMEGNAMEEEIEKERR